ncbi:hypothetical protein ACFPPA_04675 [Rhodanobacter ginsengisoli]|uniref:Uncharacterized protein n=1 Tax=Rhodanobacter ginsengisoli TaxID=418646 RepID=A0ABW0QJB5_9GAMM
MSVGRFGAGILCWLLASSLGGPAVAQLAPRLTGSIVLTQLEAARHDLAARAARLPQSSLGATSQHLASMADALRRTLGNDAVKPIDTIGTEAKGSAYRAYAAAQRARAYLDATRGCLDADATAMAEALASTVDLLAAASGSSKLQPVINGVETMDHRPLFVLRESRKEMAFALVGENLFDAQCESPLVTATDRQGRPQSVQPSVTGLSPSRIELKLPDSTGLPSGGYVLHVRSRRKAFLVGCTSQPEAIAAVQVAAPAKLSVSYSLTATCGAGHGGAGHAMPPIAGTMPDISGAGTVSQRIVIEGCTDPLSYAISAKVTFGDGHGEAIGPISQIASAGITAGLPGGLSLSWDPSVRQLFVRASGNSCKGIY